MLFNAIFAKGRAAVQPYKYNAKELDRMHGLTWYDYGARMYDPQLCRFTTVDPLADKYYASSPYAYCVNNPVLLVDPDGREVVEYDDEEYGDYYNISGKHIGSDDYKDGKRYVLTSDWSVSDAMSQVEANGKISSNDGFDMVELPDDIVLEAALGVAERMKSNRGRAEEASLVYSKESGVEECQRIKVFPRGADWTDKDVIPTASVSYCDARHFVASLHSHPTIKLKGVTSPANIVGVGDPVLFQDFPINIIVGTSSGPGPYFMGLYKQGAKAGSQPYLWMKIEAVNKIINNTNFH